MKEQFITIAAGVIQEGKTWERFLKTLPDGRGLFKYESKTKHSSEQRSYYHAVITPHILIMLRELGYNEFRRKEDAHEFCKLYFNPQPFLNIKTGELQEIPGSTKKMSKERYRQYIDDILMFAAEKGYFIPEPTNPEDKYLKQS